MRDLQNADLRKALEAPVLISQLEVSDGGRLVPRLQSWAEYWRLVGGFGNKRISFALQDLGGIWRRYISSSFDASLTREYCFQYFALLDAVLTARHESSSLQRWRRLLQAVLSFECFGIGESNFGGCPEAGCTTTLRNPCYLLSRLKWHEAPDDTRYLPLITAGPGIGNFLFHYRRYQVSGDSPLSLLVYPSAHDGPRSESFRLLSSLASAIGATGDPYAPTRAERLWDNVVRPILQATNPRSSTRRSLEFVDIGAGTGEMTALLARHVVSWSEGSCFPPRFGFWLIDQSRSVVSDFRTAPLAPYVSHLEIVNQDYCKWLARPKVLPPARGIRIAIASKVFDTASSFSIRNYSTDVLLSTFDDEPGMRRGRFMPERCLDRGGEGEDALRISSSRLPVADGHAYALPSLSNYFRGLSLVQDQDGATLKDDECPVLVVRSPEPMSLATSEGMSVLGRLVEECDYLIVEDADLRARDLVDHMKAFSLTSVEVLDMTQTMKLKASYAYVMWRGRKVKPPLEGERIW